MGRGHAPAHRAFVEEYEMSVLIKGMKMPEYCDHCPFDIWGTCAVDSDIICTFPPVTRASACPLVEVPPHGRLIDADALFDKVFDYYGEDSETAENWMMQFILRAPTVIPADKGEES